MKEPRTPDRKKGGRRAALAKESSNTKLFVAFGGIPLKNAAVAQGGTGEHMTAPALRAVKDKGVRFVCISPLRDDMPEWLDARGHIVAGSLARLPHGGATRQTFCNALQQRPGTETGRCPQLGGPT